LTSDTTGLSRAQALLMAHRPADALSELSSLSAGEATSPAAFYLRAAALNTLERWSEAAQAARAGLEAGGPKPELLGQLSQSLRNLGDLPGAERAILDALALAPTDVDHLCAYARLCTDAGQLDKAAKLSIARRPKPLRRRLCTPAGSAWPLLRGETPRRSASARPLLRRIRRVRPRTLHSAGPARYEDR
jgi:hypothetical protein